MNSTGTLLDSNKEKRDRQTSSFKHLLKERRIFSTPWHWYVHGLGLGQDPIGFQPDKSPQLLSMSLALVQKTGSKYHFFTHYLLQATLEACAYLSLGDHLAQSRANDHFKTCIHYLPQEPWQYARACAVLSESLVKLMFVEPFKDVIRQHLQKAMRQLVQLSPESDKYCYEQVQMLASLMLAAGQTECLDVLEQKVEGKDNYIECILKMAANISEPFYYGRGSAIAFSVLAIVGNAEQIYDGQQDYLRILLETFDQLLNSPSIRNSDGVHQGADFCIFPLSLILNAIAVLDCPEYLSYKRNWPQQALSIFQFISPASKASQISFLIHSLNNLGIIEDYISDMSIFFKDCMSGYLQETDGLQVDDYLRCTYLIHLAFQFNRTDWVDSRIWSILRDNIGQLGDVNRSLESTYGSSYMMAAYALSVFDQSDDLGSLFNEDFNLTGATLLFNDAPASAVIHSPRAAFALLEAGLRMRPVDVDDTHLFRSLRLGGS